jgi:hypothetical protein
MSQPNGKFPGCGQAFRPRYLGAVQPFYLFSVLVQPMDHVVEGTTEAPEFVVAIVKAHRDFEVTFSHSDNLVAKLPYRTLWIIATVGCS